MVNNSMRGLFTKSLALTGLLISIFPRSAQSEVIIQYFETPWDQIYQRLPEIAEIGYESIWTPPPGKSPIGGPYAHAYGGNVGYNSYDRFDLGDHPQRGSWETRYGSRTSLRQMVDNAHQMDLKIYPDIVFNHTGNGPDYRTYPGMVPQDFHVWVDASQPGGFRRAPRMSQWTPDNGFGGTLHQELVSLMDIVLEFDGRFQGSNAPNYAPDPTPFVRHPGDHEKYPYHPVGTTLPTENSRQFVTRWINWLGYAMDYDGVRLDAPKHVGKEYFGLPNQNLAERDQSLIYNIQKNFNERRGLSDTNPFDDMYSNYILRDDALVYSEFFIGSIGETDYWRNPSDRNWGIQTRYLDFPRKSQMIMAAFNGGNLAALDNVGAGFSPEEGVIFAHSHDEDPPGKLELAYAYILTRVGTPVVYFTGNNLADNEDKEENGITWMRKGYDGALGDNNMGTIPNLIYIHNQFARGREFTRWAEGDFFAFERYDDLNSNGQPNPGEGLLLVVLNDSGFDQTRNGIQTSFAPGTVLKDYTGRNPNTVTVGSGGTVNITVGGWWGQGFGCWAPFNAEGPASGPAITFAGSGVSTMPWVVPGGRDAAAKPRTVTRLTGNSVTINVFYREPAQGGETVNSGILKWGQGRNLNATAADIGGKDVVNAGYETMTRVADGHYRLEADLTGVPEGLHTIKARLFNGRASGRPALYQTFTTTVYVDRSGPDLTFANLNAGATVEGARVVTVENSNRTVFNLTYSVNGGPTQQADQVIQGRWRLALEGLAAGLNSITLTATEADRATNRAVINSNTVTRSFNVDTNGPAISINHAPGAVITEPFFKTIVTVPTGQGITASDIKLFWNGYEQLPLTENPAGSGKFESTFTGRYVQGGTNKIFYGAFVNGPHFFEAVVTKSGQENRAARRVVFNLYGQNLHDSDGDGLPDNIEIENFLSGRNPGPNRALPGDGAGLDNIPNYGEQWTRLNPMNAETFYNGTWDGDNDFDNDGISNLQELIRGFRISGDVYAYNIYSASSVPPSTIGSFASSSLSMSGGNKIVTITYRPNEGPLANASAVTVNITPVGGGTAQSFAMSGGPTEFTYSYTVPSGATALNYTFANGGTTDNTGGASWSASTSAAFVMDGQFDSQNFLVTDSGMRIYAAIRGNKLYTATWSPKGGGNDHVIYITDAFGNPVTAAPAVGSDSASNYSSWGNGSNQGTGFDTWAISTGGTSSGAFIGNPSSAGIQGMSAQSFGLFANGGATSSATAIRSFPALNVGDSIAFQWSINWDGGNGADGKKGFNLWAGTTFLMNIENAGSADINIGGSSSGMGYGTAAMNWTITRTAANTLDVRVTRRDGGVFTRTLTVSSSAPTRLEFYASNLNGGGTMAQNTNRQPYFNDLRIYRNGASAKGGQVYGAFDGSSNSKPWLFSTPNTASTYGFKASGRNWLGNQGQAVEGELDLVEVFGSVPRILYVAAVAYSGGTGGTIVSQAPPLYGNSGNDLEIPEYQPLNTASLRDEDLDGRFDVGNPEMIVAVGGNETDGNYGLRRFYLDELAGETSSLTIKFKPNTAAAPSQVEVFTNLNRRDFAVLEEDPSTVTTSSNTYFRGYTMSGPNADGYYTATLPVELCGAYRLQVRYKVPGVNSGNFIYYTDNGLRRDCAIVVSPRKALAINMYEVNPLIVEAKDATEAGRSTFLDLVNDPSIPAEVGGYQGRPDALNKDHYAALGVNMLWLQPIHPIGVEGRDINPETPGQPFDPGSPYAVRDYWSVAPMLGRSNTAANALSEFQTFVSRLDQWGVGVMMDGTFNHSAPDVIMGQGAVDLGITANANQQIRNFNPGWYAKEGFPGTPAANTNEIAIAPDRNDFGNWTDVREFYFGNYDALVKEKGTQNPDKSYPDNAFKLAFLLERDDFEGHTSTTRQVWNYFAHYPIYWLEKSGHTSSTPKSQSHVGIDGLRCDFAQGLPSQFWEYAINKTRARKWDFIFMAESLDGARTVGNSSRHGVGYRSARHFDVLNENIVFYWRDTFFGYPANGGAGTAKSPNTFDTWKAFDDRRTSFDNVVLLNNLVSHDEVFPHNDVWRLAYAYAQTGVLDGIPMILYGQEAGAQNSKTGYGASEANFGSINALNNVSKYEQNFGKNIPNFKVYNHMTSIWSNRTTDEWRLQDFYGRVNRARLAAPALMSQNMYFLSKKETNGGYEANMLAVGKVQNLGQTGGGTANSVVFAFVNNNHLANSNVAATFDLNAKVPGSDLNYFGIDRGRNYNVKDLLADNATAYVWATNRTGADLIDNGLYVGLPNTTAGTGSYQAQYLQLVDVSSPSLSFVPPQFMTFGTTNTLTSSTTPASTVTYSLVSGDTNKVSLSGDKLVINSGTGSVVVRATVAATADRGGATADATITFQKASQTITFDPSSTTGSTSDPARTLIATSSSGLTVSLSSGNPGVASLIGNTLYFNSAGSAVITASQAGNENYEAATAVTRTYTVTGASFANEWSGQDATSDANGDGVPALAEYALGGVAGSNNLGVLPQMTRSNNTLTLSALVRTNDPKLSVFPQASANLGSNGWSTSGFTTNSTTNGVPTGFVRRTYTYDASSNTRAFLRLFITNSP
jgi:glycosidase